MGPWEEEVRGGLERTEGRGEEMGAGVTGCQHRQVGSGGLYVKSPGSLKRKSNHIYLR